MKKLFLLSTFALACMFGVASCNKDKALKIGLTDIKVSPDAVNLVINDTLQLTAIAVPENATDLTFTWSSDAESVAEVNSSSGLVTAKSAGTASIKVTGVGGGITKTKTLPVTVTEEVIELQSISVTPDTVVKPYGDTAHVTATCIPANATGVTLTWASSNPLVATVSQEGVITVTGVGTAKVTASFGAIKSPEIDVTGTIRGLAIRAANGKPDGAYIYGDKVTLTAVIDPDNTGLQAEWSTSNQRFATVELAEDNTAEVTIVGEDGYATISATIGTFKADYYVTVVVSSSTDLTSLYSIDPNRNILWGFKNMYHPCIVKREDSDYPYLMYFFGWAATDTNEGWPGCDAIFLARGKDFDKWEVYSKKKDLNEYYWDSPVNGTYSVAGWCPILCAGNTWFDSWHIGDPSVVLKDGKYYMAASSYGKDQNMTLGGRDGDISCIMGAVSDDGIHFTKTSYPIAIWEPEIGKNEPLTGSGSYQVDFGTNEFYGLYHRPSILWDEEDKCWKMWFDYIGYYNAETNLNLMGMGYAENRGEFMNPLDWKVIRADDNPCLAHMCNPDVVKIDGHYICYGDPDVVYYGANNERLLRSGWTRRQLCEAKSANGLDWSVTGFIMPDDNTWANHVPCLYCEQGKLYIFYATQIGFGNVNNPGNNYDYRYDNIRYMSRSINW